MSRESTSQHQLQGQDGPALTTSQHVLLQKQQEYAGLQALRESSAEMVQRVEKLGEMSSIMADGGEGEFCNNSLRASSPLGSGSMALLVLPRSLDVDRLSRTDHSSRTSFTELAPRFLRPQPLR